MRIKNKLQSVETIEKLGLNRVEETVFHAGQEKEVLSYLEKTNYKLYGIRDKSGGGGMFKHGVLRENVLAEIQGYKIFSLCQSLKKLDENNMILQGDIQIGGDMRMLATLNDERGISLRQATGKPKHNISVDLLEQKDPKIRGINKIIDYIFHHELFDVVVEFTLYNCLVGCNNEEIIIWELRNY